tara:strand:- start:1042 stop:1290 length:249 start_codon:yes stop_codon:yes gene_type:complete
MNPIEINEDCKFLKDCTDNPNLAMYNLITSKGAVQLWTKGIKVDSNWTLKSVKNYFGVTGNAEKIQLALETMYEAVTNKGGK